jgi:GNAT superfamily N-acetyltransferase
MPICPPSSTFPRLSFTSTSRLGERPTEVLSSTHSSMNWSPMPEVRIEVVAEIADRVVGFASGRPGGRRVSDFNGELYAIDRLDEHRGRGIGSALFKAVVEQLLALGLDWMKVWSLQNHPYRNFYGRQTIRIEGLDLIEVAYG